MKRCNESESSVPKDSSTISPQQRQSGWERWKQFLEQEGKSATHQDLVDLLNALDALRF